MTKLTNFEEICEIKTLSKSNIDSANKIFYATHLSPSHSLLSTVLCYKMHLRKLPQGIVSFGGYTLCSHARYFCLALPGSTTTMIATVPTRASATWGRTLHLSSSRTWSRSRSEWKRGRRIERDRQTKYLENLQQSPPLVPLPTPTELLTITAPTMTITAKTANDADNDDNENEY